MDDNCTTGRSLQFARDALVLGGADVVGAIVVRYPGTNRYVQMRYNGHGLPDPEVLLSFIRGLVKPSPYTRLIKSSGIYLDDLGVFDKYKDRTEKYLQKNRVDVHK